MNNRPQLDIVSLTDANVTYHRESTSNHPSGSARCLRQEWYRINKSPQSHPMPRGTQWKLSSYGLYEGFFVEAALNQLNRLMVTPQFELEYGDWHGKVDLAIQQDWGLDLVEIKSINPWAFRYGSIPYQHHLAQAQIYWVMANEMGIHPGDVYLVYIERWQERQRDWLPRLHDNLFDTAVSIQEPEPDIPTILQFDVTPTTDECAEVMTLMLDYDKATHSEQVPERPYGDPNEHKWDCTAKVGNDREIRCPWFNLCWGEGVEYGYA